MKAVLVKITGELEPDDLIILSAIDSLYGGQSNAHVRVRPERDEVIITNGTKSIITHRDTIGEIIQRITHEINSHFGGSVKATKRNENEFIIQCTDVMERVRFNYTTEGSKKQLITIEDLG